MLISFNWCIGFALCSTGSDAGLPVTNFLYLQCPLTSRFIKIPNIERKNHQTSYLLLKRHVTAIQFDLQVLKM